MTLATGAVVTKFRADRFFCMNALASAAATAAAASGGDVERLAVNGTAIATSAGGTATLSMVRRASAFTAA